MMNKITAILLVSVVGCFAAEYKPLSGADQKLLVDNYKAVKEAYAEKNFASILKFVPEMITKFESVIMDPECKKLRPLYLEIELILDNVRYSIGMDSLDQEATGFLKKNDIESALVTYDKILSALHRNDSNNIPKFRKKFDSLVVKAEKKQNLATYSILTSLTHINRERLKGCKYEMSDQFDEKIARLSASMNPDSLYQFKKNYPDVKPDLVRELVDRARTAMRQSLLRQPSISGYLHYKELFGDDKLLHDALKNRCFTLAFAVETPDPLPIKDFVTLFPEEEQKIWQEFEDFLFQKWNKKPSEIYAQNYLKLFPQGRYAQIVYEGSAEKKTQERDADRTVKAGK
jgi:hypothetical protein